MAQLDAGSNFRSIGDLPRSGRRCFNSQGKAIKYRVDMEMEMDMEMESLAHRRQIRTAPMRHLSRHTNALAQRGARVNGFADVHRICTHFNRQGNPATPAN